jgi:hypothetical protein
MDAPVYPPAAAYEAPAPAPRVLSTKDSSIAELQANPAAWAIILKEMPSIEARLSTPMLKPHLGNFSFRSLTQFGLVKAPELDRVDPQLLALGPVK